MKFSKKASIFACAFFAACATMNAEVIDLDLTKTPTSVTDMNQDLSNPTIYTYNGNPYTGELSADTNINVNYTFPDNTINNNALSKALSSFTAKNLTYNLNLPANFWSNNIFYVDTAKTVNLESFNVNLLSCVVSHPNISVGSYGGANLNISGDVKMIDSRPDNTWFMTRLEFLNKGAVNVGGNLTMSAQGTKVQGNGLNTVFLTTSVVSFTVGGAVKLENLTKVSANNIWRMTSDSKDTFTRTIGGLDVASKGSLHLHASAVNANTTNLIFTNKAKSEYVGGLATRKATDGTLAASKLNITMDAADAENGRQIMRFQNVADWSLDNIKLASNAEALNEVTVKKGRLDLAMYDGMKADTLIMEGGKFSATGESGEIGAVNFGYMTLSGGKIYADLSEADGNDIVNVANQVTKLSDTTKLTFEIGVTSADLQAWLEAAEVDTWSVNLLTYATSGSNITKSDMLLELKDGVSGNISLSELAGVTTVVANLTTVPEPATVAAIFGALALALAFYRRRG